MGLRGSRAQMAPGGRQGWPRAAARVMEEAHAPAISAPVITLVVEWRQQMRSCASKLRQEPKQEALCHC